MKWFTGSSKLRREEWFTSPPPRRECVKEAHKWCTGQGSEHQFYYHYTNTRWWFEDKEDAVFFALKFSG